MSNEQLDDIEARANAATEGPFTLSRYDHGGGRMFAQTANGQRGSLILDTFKEGDREFYAEARTDVPALLALVREQQARIKQVEALASRWATLGASHAYYSKRVRHALKAKP